MAEYPEHEKIKALNGANQIVGDFIEWLGERGYAICIFNEHHEEYVPAREPRDALIAKHFEIDANKLEDEKRHMLAVIRGEGAGEA